MDYVCGACARASALGHELAAVTIASGGTIEQVCACASYLTPQAAPSPIAEALRRFKYSGDRLTGRRLAAFFARHTSRRRWDCGCVVPIPLHRSRMRERGFNQAAWLSRALARTLGLPHDYSRLLRVCATPPQAGARRALRERNVEGAFAAHARYARPMHVLLVDDVVTTGATATAAAAELRRAGAWRVDLAVLLHTPPPGRTLDDRHRRCHGSSIDMQTTLG